MKSAIADKVIVLTGASSGVGAAAARQLSDKGAIVVLAARSLDKLDKVASKLKGKHETVRLDVTDEEQVRQAMSFVRERYGRIDVLINNAGFGEFVSFPEAKLSQFQEMMDVNYFGVVRCCQAVFPYMREAGAGHIVNVASIAGKLATSKSTAYTASKHALLGFTNSLRQDCRGTGIKVSAVNPGPIDTPFFERADPEGTYVRNLGSFMLKPEQVASAIVKVIERGTPEIDMPFISGFGAKLFQLFPRFADKVLSGIMNKK